MKVEKSPSPVRSSETRLDEGVCRRPHFFAMTYYTLPPIVHAASLNGIYVLLDERADRYLCLNEKQSCLLAGLLDGDENPQARKFANSLVTSGLLCRASEPPPPSAPRTKPTYSAYKLNSKHQLRLRDWPATLLTLRDVQRIRRRHLSDNLRALRQNKSGGQLVNPATPANVGEMAGRFTDFCDLFLTRTDQCLSRSLLLARFLTVRRIPADLVIGVKLGPFAAHAWVEYEGSVVNDHLETVQAYTPILCI